MSTGPGVAMPKAGSNKFVAMFLGTAFFAGVVGTFYYSRFAAHRRADDPTWIARHGQQQPDHMHNGPRLVSTTDGGAEPNNQGKPHVPLPGNDDNRGSEGATAGLMSAVAGRSTSSDGKVPKNPGNIQEPAPQRRNDDGSHYTKAGNYAESYKERLKDPNHGPEDGRS